MKNRLARRSAAVVTGALLFGLLAVPQVAHGGVGDAQRKVNQVLQELEDLRNELGRIDEDYHGARDRQDELIPEIEASQARVDEMTAVLGDLELVLQKIALDRFTKGDSTALSPIFSSASAYGEAGQRSALATLAISDGQGQVDDVQALVDDLTKEREVLTRKQEEAAQLILTLESKKAEMVDLEANYLAKYAKAERDLGKTKLAAAEQAREQAVAQQAQRRRDADARALAAIPRGSGAAPRYTGAVPAVSGSAGIAVQAAYSQIGVPYIAFAAAPGTGFDCSGLTQWVWGRAGVRLPHQSGRQFNGTPNVPQDQVQPGDLIFYYAPISHVGIYVGGGQMIHAPAPGKHVGLTKVSWNKVVGVSRPG